MGAASGHAATQSVMREALLFGEGAAALLSALGAPALLERGAAARAWALPAAPRPKESAAGSWSLLTSLCGVTRAAAWVWAYPIDRLLQGSPSLLEREALALARLLCAPPAEGEARGALWLTASPRLTSIERFEAPARAERLLRALGVDPRGVRVLLPPPEGSTPEELAARLARALEAPRAALSNGAAPTLGAPTLGAPALGAPTLGAQLPPLSLDLVPIAAGEVEGFEGQVWRVARPFAIGQTLVTRALRDLLLGAPAAPTGPRVGPPPPAPHPLDPASRLSWLDAARLCNALSRALGLEPYYLFVRDEGDEGDEPSNEELERGGWRVLVNPRGEESLRLPTSDEWCYAAAAGLPTAYAGGDNVDQVAWSAQSAGSKLHPVAELAPNRWGLYDMSGLLWEWCEDGVRDAEARGERAQEGAQEGAKEGGARALCLSARQPKWLLGGSWANHPWVFPLGERLAELPSYADDFMGLRLARTLPAETPALAPSPGRPGGLELRSSGGGGAT